MTRSHLRPLLNCSLKCCSRSTLGLQYKLFIGWSVKKVKNKALLRVHLEGLSVSGQVNPKYQDPDSSSLDELLGNSN